MEKEVAGEKKRPQFITVLCVIAFIHVGLSIILGLLGTVLSPELGWFRTSGLLGLFSDGMSHLLGLFWSVIMIILSIAGFMGIIQIWNMMRSGIWLFSIPMLLTILLPLVFLGVGWWILIPNITIVFLLIFLFAINYRKFS